MTFSRKGSSSQGVWKDNQRKTTAETSASKGAPNSHLTVLTLTRECSSIYKATAAATLPAFPKSSFGHQRIFLTSVVLEQLVTQQLLTLLSSSLSNYPLFPTPLSAEQFQHSRVILSPLLHLTTSSSEQEFPGPAKTMSISETHSCKPITFLKGK